MSNPKIEITEAIPEKAWKMSFNGVQLSIYRSQKTRGNYKYYEIRWKIGKKTKRRCFTDKEKAFSEADNIIRQLANARGATTEVSSSDLIYLIECQKKLGDTPMLVAVDHYLSFHRGLVECEVSKSVDEFVAFQKERGCASRYIGTIRNHLEIFAREFTPRNVSTIQQSEYERYISERGWTPKTQGNFLRSAMTFLNFCKKKGYIPKNNATPVEEIEPPKVRRSTPVILTVEEMANLLSICTRRDLAFITISAFGGGRRAEIQRLRYKDIDLEHRQINLSSEITKTNQRRTLEINDALSEWLAKMPAGEPDHLIVPIEDPLMDLRDKYRERGWAWKANALRHSFCSYHLAKHKNAAMTAELAGNSAEEIRRSYKALVTPKAADMWFTLTPTKIKELAAAHNVQLDY